MPGDLLHESAFTGGPAAGDDRLAGWLVHGDEPGILVEDAQSHGSTI
jgi:hypothetical protein